jgi:5-methylcytosine-specific restriction protein A
MEQGRTVAAQEVDHVIPLFKGGPDKWENLQSLCKACHIDKTCEDLGQNRKPQIGFDGWPVDTRGGARK